MTCLFRSILPEDCEKLQLVATGWILRHFFNYLIYHSTDYHSKAGLAAYKSFEDYRLFDDGYVESLLTAQLNQEGVHVYVGKCGLS